MLVTRQFWWPLTSIARWNCMWVNKWWFGVNYSFKWCCLNIICVWTTYWLIYCIYMYLSIFQMFESDVMKFFQISNMYICVTKCFAIYLEWLLIFPCIIMGCDIYTSIARQQNYIFFLPVFICDFLLFTIEIACCQCVYWHRFGFPLFRFSRF